MSVLFEIMCAFLILSLIVVIFIILGKIAYELWNEFNIKRYLCYKCKHCLTVKDPRKFENPYRCEIQRDSVDGVMRCTEFELKDIKKESKKRR